MASGISGFSGDQCQPTYMSRAAFSAADLMSVTRTLGSLIRTRTARRASGVTSGCSTGFSWAGVSPGHRRSRFCSAWRPSSRQSSSHRTRKLHFLPLSACEPGRAGGRPGAAGRDPPPSDPTAPSRPTPPKPDLEIALPVLRAYARSLLIHVAMEACWRGGAAHTRVYV